jgi:hypothetical protein
MIITAIDYTTGVVTYDCGDLEIPVQEDWDIIPDLRLGGEFR